MSTRAGRDRMSVSRLVVGVLSISLGLASTFGLGTGTADATGAGAVREGKLGRRAEAVDPLTIVDQNFTLAANEVLNFTLGLPPGLDSTTLGQEGTPAVVKVSIYRDASTRDEVRSATAGDFGLLGDDLAKDTFTLSLDTAQPDPRVGRPQPDRLVLAVPTESVDTADALLVPFPGIYPVVVDLLVYGEVVAEAITFVHRVDDGAAPQDDLSLGLFVGQTIEPTIDVDGNVVPTDAEIAELTNLAGLLEALDAVPAELGIDVTPPRAVRVEASILASLPTADPGLAARLRPLLERSEMVATTKLPLDPSTAVRNTQQDLYSRWLVEGEDVFAATVPGANTDRSMFLVSQPTSTDAALMRRGLGTRMLVLTPDVYLSTPGGFRGYTDTSQLATVDLGGGDSIPAAVIDPQFAAMLDQPSTDPLKTAIAMAAELFALKEQLGDMGEDISTHGMMIGRSDGGVPDPAVLTDLTRLLMGTTGVALVEPSRLASITTSQLAGGHPIALEFPAVAGDDQSARLETIDEISVEYLGVTSMLPEDDPAPKHWATVREAMPSTALTDAEVDAMVAALRADFKVYLDGVEGPAAFTVTLTGTKSSIPIGITNNTTTPLKVKITMSSAKLTFPANDQVYELPPMETYKVRIPVEARSNGKFGVALQILMPATGAEVVPTVVLTARVNALTGLAQLVTGAALLVLATWWLRHWRISRRRRLAADHHHRHPAVNGAKGGKAGRGGKDAGGAPGGPLGGGDDLAPDAAASSLPPS